MRSFILQIILGVILLIGSTPRGMVRRSGSCSRRLWFELLKPASATQMSLKKFWDLRQIFNNLNHFHYDNNNYQEDIVDREPIALFHFFDHSEEEIKQFVGTLLHAPDNTTGCYWSPEVPETMPAEDTQYYELPIENGDNQSGGDQGGSTGGGTGGNYPPGYDPDADLDPGV